MGGFKATLYSYFKSKEELFAAAVQQAVGARSDAAFDHITGGGDLRKRLMGFGRTYLETRLTPDMVSVDRALIADADRSDLGAILRTQFLVPLWRRFAVLLEQDMAAGRLRQADPYTATLHFRGTIEGDILERRMHGETSARVDDKREVGLAALELL